MRRFYSWIVLVLCVCMLCPAASAQDESVIVSVDRIEFKHVPVQAYFDTLARSACESNNVSALTREQAEQLRDAVIKQYVFQGVVQNMYGKLGLDTFTADEEAEFRAQAQTQQDELIDAATKELQKNYPEASEEKLRAYALATLEIQDITPDALYTAIRETALLNRMLDYVTPGLSITDEQVDAAYEEQYVATEREAFGDNIYMYELYMYDYDYAARYIPAGFRYVKRILLAVPEALQAELDAQQTVINDAYEAIATAEKAMGKVPDGDDAAMVAANDAFQEANRAYDAALTAQDAIKRRILEAMKPTTDEIASKYASGTSFAALMDEYSTDEASSGDAEPFLVHAESYFCEEALRDAAMALKEPGDISQPILTDSGVQLAYYVGEAPAYIPMDEATRKAVYETLIETTRYDALVEKAAEWQSQFTVFTYPEGIDLTDAMTAPTEETADAAK